jgi:hypothetical protein
MSTTTPSPKTFIKFVDNTPKSFSNSNLHRAEITFNYNTVTSSSTIFNNKTKKNVTTKTTSNNISNIKLNNIPTDITNVSIVYGVNSNSTVSKTPDTGEKNTITTLFYPVLTSAIINYGDKLNFFSNFSSNGFALNFTNNNISVTIPSANNFFTPPIPDNFTVRIKIVILYSIDYKYYDTSSTYEYYQNQNISKYIGIF